MLCGLPEGAAAARCLLLQDILQRAGAKEELLDEANRLRTAYNDRRRIERELYNGLRLDKVDSIQKTQVGGWVGRWGAHWRLRLYGRGSH
jgi:hypothetical protein